MPAVFDLLRSRKTSHIATHDLSGADFRDDSKALNDYDASGSDSDTLSLEARNEKEVQQHPDRVTAGAQAGIQKAEAAALVWSKKAIFATYAWYRPPQPTCLAC